ncbi:aminopeptidase P family protein [Dyadobacter sediminis]|uniref:Xaa-Pro aminopeptidase n=1 Tax=Dyadobacter sediminis TaxID=1493691 RepID=A0A5R9K8Q2_9BACT|nr:aminopeptidase P family protein [Dyadobacter sediminis]TLU90380.1 aminopeptidase P family protein [Dyadobacter sediminis]GGC07306.1 Xaa-Pro aminopeptidase [Dyadobacter sediminis]
MFSKQTYISRRNALKQKVGSGLVLLLGNLETGMNYRDNVYPFRQDSSFLYYFGLDVASLHALIDIDNDREMIFGDELTIDDIVWTGPKEALAEKAGKAGVSEVKPLAALSGFLRDAMSRKQQVHYLPPYRAEHTLQLQEWLACSPAQVSEQVSVKLIKAVVSMRSYKSSEEIVEIEKAVDTSVDMHLEFMQATRPGMTEKEVAAKLQSMAIARNGDIAYPVILTVNGEILHTHARDLPMQEGQMALCDAGAETAMHYCGDLTRTIPMGRQFTTVQKEMYEIVLYAQKSAIEACKPGILFRDVHALASLKLLEGLQSVGIIKGDPAEALSHDVHTLFFQCGLGHMMGLDVHDMENLGEQYVGYTDDLRKGTTFGWKSLRLGRALEAGFVITVEPGLYLIPTLIDRWKAENKLSQFIDYNRLEQFRNFTGIRIEDNLLITESGNRTLGKELVKETSEVEALRG